MIPLDDLLPHPLNSNVMPPDLQEKLRAHIKRTGRYPFLVVRPHPEQPGKYQVLDGHHRVAILRDLGHTEARRASRVAVCETQCSDTELVGADSNTATT